MPNNQTIFIKFTDEDGKRHEMTCRELAKYHSKRGTKFGNSHEAIRGRWKVRHEKNLNEQQIAGLEDMPERDYKRPAVRHRKKVLTYKEQLIRDCLGRRLV